jgi:hypothetical protein
MIRLNEPLGVTEHLDSLREKFLQGSPFQYLVIENPFPLEVLRRVVAELPEIHHNARYNDATTQGKQTCDDWNLFPPNICAFISYLNSGIFVRFLTTITGIPGLISDPYLQGGGIHETLRGGFLKMHTDFNFHTVMKLDRRINAILFLNEGWQSSWGGELVLSDRGMKTQVRIEPLFNRLVIFNTNDFSFHGQPDPHAFPEGSSRKSIAMYYYSNGRPDSETTSRKVGTSYRTRYAGDIPMRTRLRETARLWLGLKRPR